MMKLRWKVSMPFLVAILVLIILTLGWVAYAAVNYMAQTTEALYRHPFTVSTAVLRIQSNILRMHQIMQGVTRIESAGGTMAMKEEVEKLEAEILSDFSLLQERYLGDPRSVQDALQAFEGSYEIRRQILQLCLTGNHQAALNILQESGLSQMRELESKTNIIRDFAQEKATSFMLEARTQRDRTGVWILGALTGLMIIASAVFYKAIHLEKNLRETNTNLDMKVRERTADLSAANENLFAMNEELQAQQEELRAMNEELQAQQEELRVMNEEREKLNLQLMDVNQELELRVDQRTQALMAANQELQNANCSLEEEIDERTRVEELLRNKEDELVNSNETLSLAIGLARLGPWKYNPKTDLFEFDDDFYVLFSTSVAQEGRFMASDVYINEFVHPGDAWIVVREINNVRTSADCGYANQLEHRIIRRDGEVCTVVVQTHSIKTGDGKILIQYGAVQDITERVRTKEALLQKAEIIHRMAYYDSLTNLPNRRCFLERLEEEIKKACTLSSQGAVFYIDLDDLKLVNDTYGHSCGDDIIAEAGARIVKALGSETFAARIGGDEFFAILPSEMDRRQIVSVAKKVLRSLEKMYEAGGAQFHMTASIGISFYPTDGNTAEEIIKSADNAMYAAKNAGKNCWQFFSKAMQEDKFHQMQLMNSLRYAIQSGELSVYYQPQIKTQSNEIIGFEALLRWNSAQYGMVPPAQFIPLAEKNDLIYSIGHWVFQEACRFLRKLSDLGWGKLRVAVNISSKQLVSDNFIDLIRQAITEAGVDAQQVELEVTESILMGSMQDALTKLNELKALGVYLTLDDFGMGYSSLTYLCNLPFNIVKIDKGFIDKILIDERVEQIIGAIINLAHVMGMSVVGEGVETEAQFSRLKDRGCDNIQGYLFSRPVTEQDVLALLETVKA